MATTPRIRTRNPALLGGGSSGPTASGEIAASISRAGAAVAGGLRDQAQAKDRIERDRAAQYIAERAPSIELKMTEVLEAQKEASSSESIDEFTDVYRESLNATIDEEVAQAPALAQDALRARLIASSERAAAKAVRFEAQEAARYQGEAFEAGAQAAGAQLVSDPSLLEEKLAQQYEAIDSLSAPGSAKAAYKERTAQLLGVSAAEGAIFQDPRAALERLQDGEFDELIGPSDKATLIRRAQTRINSEEATARAEVTALKNSINDEISFITEATIDGVRTEVAPEEVRQMIVDNDLQDEMPRQMSELDLLIDVQGDAQRFRRDGTMGTQDRPEGVPVLSMMDATRDALVAADRTQRTRESHMRVQMAEAQMRQVEARMKNDPMLGLVEAGIIEERPQIDVESPTGWETAMGALEQARAYYGQPVTPFSTDQVDAMRSYLEAQPPDAQAAYLQQMVGGMPQEQTDAVAAQISGRDDAPLSVALAMAGRRRGDVARQILTGRQIEQSDLYALTDADFRDALPDDYAEAFDGAPGALDTYFQAAKALYASMVPQSDLGDDSVVDGQVFQQAFDMISGASVVRFNGRAILPPVDGMTEDDFDTAVRMIEPGDFTAYGRVKAPGRPFSPVGEGGIAVAPGTETPGADRQILTPEILLRDGTFVPAADGIYYVDLNGQRVTGGDGLPYAFDMRAFLKDPEVTARPEPLPPGGQMARRRRGG